MCLNDWAVSVKVEKFDDTEWKYTERDLMQMKYRTIVDCMGMVDGQQTVDAVPVVRCKDCLFSKCIEEKHDWWACERDYRVNHGNGFCNWAERKE